MVAEVEALVSRSFTPYPTRISECMKKEQLATLISILEQRGGLSLYDKNVVLKTAGGLKLSQPSANLASLAAIVSSALDRAIPAGTVFIGDVGLTGELKRVPSMELMVRELDRMKLQRVFLPAGWRPDGWKPTSDLQICPAGTLQDVLTQLFGERRSAGKS